MSDPRDPFASAREEQAPAPPTPARPYSIAVGFLFLAVVVFAGITLTREHRGALGLEPGTRLPDWAAPSATGAIEGDANVFQSRRESGADNTPACKVRGRDVIRICDYFDRPLVLVAWFSRCGTCAPQLDTAEAVRRRFPQVAFVGLDIRDPQDKARRAVREHGWRFPMAVDRDGAVGALYGVGVGPTTFFAYPGGVLSDTALGELKEADLVTRVRALVRVSKRRARVRAAGRG